MIFCSLGGMAIQHLPDIDERDAIIAQQAERSKQLKTELVALKALLEAEAKAAKQPAPVSRGPFAGKGGTQAAVGKRRRLTRNSQIGQ